MLNAAAAAAAAGLTVAYNSSTGQLTITGTASKATYQTILDGVVYNNTDQDPDTTARDVTVVVNDGLLSSNTAHTTITVTPLTMRRR